MSRAELLKTTIRPGLAVWAAVMFTISFATGIPLELWLKAICGGLLAEWIGERGIKRVKEILGQPNAL